MDKEQAETLFTAQMVELTTFTWHGYRVPEHMREGVARYVVYGIIPGDFLQAVLCNDLGEAYARADEHNIMNMGAYPTYLYNNAPRAAYGSEKAMQVWAKHHGLSGL